MSGNAPVDTARRWIRRRTACTIELDERPWLDLGAMLRGELVPRPIPVARVRAIPGGEVAELSPAEIGILAGCGQSSWTEWHDDSATAGVQRLIDAGLLEAYAGPSPPPTSSISLTEWHLPAAGYHFASRWQGVCARDDLPADVAAAQEAYAVSADSFEAQARDQPPPEAYPERGDIGRVLCLPRPPPEAIDILLAKRETHRLFDPDKALSSADFGAIMQRSFAAHASAAMGGGLVALRKVMPSGGGLHPVEAYPLIARVEGVAPGWYHYRSGDHALAPIRMLAQERVRERIVALTAGQTYYQHAAVVIFLALRFPRHHWKYPRHAKAYRVMLLDAGHAGQAFALAVATRDLGAFFTAAINEVDADAEIGLDGLDEGVVAAVGCGHPAPGGEVMRLSHYTRAPRTRDSGD